MNLKLTNIGKIRHADIELNSITVIAGENNTGKSTVGKMLYCVFHAFYGVEEQVVAEQEKSVARALRRYMRELYNGRVVHPDVIAKLAKDIVECKDRALADRNVIVQIIEEFMLDKSPSLKQYDNRDILEAASSKIYDYLKIEDDDLRKAILRKRLEVEFAMKIGHLNHMDDPFVIDDINGSIWGTLQDEFSHRRDMLVKLMGGKKESEFTMADELVVKEKLAKVFDIMNDVCSGTVMKSESGNFIYQTDRLRGNLEMVNLSTGMKSFVILKRLLENGNIDENGVVILDEPEIHLHPEWKLRFAELIVLIQKEFGVNILLNTHSPYFLNVIEVYSKKYGINERCRYYLANETDGSTVLTDVTDNTEAIYAKAKRKYVRFGLERFEKLYFQDVYTYTEKEFEDNFLATIS